MVNPFILSDEKLKVLLTSYFAWLDKNNTEKGYVEKHKMRDEALRATLLNKDFLLSATEEDLFKEIFSYTRTLEGPAFIRLGEPRIKNESKNIKRNLLYFIESDDDPHKKAERIITGEYKVPFFAGAFWTPLFQGLQPDLLPNWNNKTSKFFRELGVEVKNRKESYAEIYKIISDGFVYLRNLDQRHEFYTINHLMHYATSVQEGVDLLDSLLGGVSAVSYWRIIEPLIAKDISAWPICKQRGLIAIGYEEDPGNHNLIRFKDNMKIGDRVVVYLKKGRIGGIGTITGDYEDYYETKPLEKDYFNGYFWRYRKVNWDMLPQNRDSWEIDRPYDDVMPGKRMTVYKLSKEEFDRIADIVGRGSNIATEESKAFSTTTFSLLEELHRNPTREFYLSRRDELKEFIEKPFQNLFTHVAENLPDSITGVMETKKNIFSRILKNDYGRGGAWDFYWGAFYPREGKRVEDAQLFMALDKEKLHFGFFIGEYGSAQRKKFVANCKNNSKVMENLLVDSLNDPSIEFGIVHEPIKQISHKSSIKWDEWLKNPEPYAIEAATLLPKDKVLEISERNLIETIVNTYKRLYPLVLLAISSDPVSEINSYMETPLLEEYDIQLEYSAQDFLKNTSMSEQRLNRWVKGLERKGQAIFYGPPGTGKTHIAEQLAKHLVGGTDGFWKILQFHPAYEYEDFIQGIRPQSRPDGTLDYKIVPGRFLEFCSEAKKRKGICALIIDEINRANLARVFGELMYLLEYRKEAVPLAGGNELSIPENIRIIGTMNTADRSIALVDHALRRRFAFFELFPDYEVLRNYHLSTGFPIEKLIKLLTDLNGEIGDRHYHVGITFFLKKDLSDQIEDIWSMEIMPYLEEYFFDQPSKLEGYRWDKIKSKLFE